MKKLILILSTLTPNIINCMYTAPSLQSSVSESVTAEVIVSNSSEEKNTDYDMTEFYSSDDEIEAPTTNNIIALAKHTKEARKSHVLPTIREILKNESILNETKLDFLKKLRKHTPYIKNPKIMGPIKRNLAKYVKIVRLPS